MRPPASASLGRRTTGHSWVEDTAITLGIVSQGLSAVPDGATSTHPGRPRGAGHDPSMLLTLPVREIVARSLWGDLHGVPQGKLSAPGSRSHRRDDDLRRDPHHDRDHHVRPWHGPRLDDAVHAARRERMVRALAASERVWSRTFDAMERTPRHPVPEHHRYVAYRDTPLPWAPARPSRRRRRPDDSAAQCPEGRRPCARGRDRPRLLSCRARAGRPACPHHRYCPNSPRQPLGWPRSGISRTSRCARDGYLGWPEVAPFDGINVTGAPTDVPEPLCAQLAEGGRMVIPLGPWSAVQWLTASRSVTAPSSRPGLRLFYSCAHDGHRRTLRHDGGPTVDDPASSSSLASTVVDPPKRELVGQDRVPRPSHRVEPQYADTSRMDHPECVVASAVQLDPADRLKHTSTHPWEPPPTTDRSCSRRSSPSPRHPLMRAGIPAARHRAQMATL